MLRCYPLTYGRFDAQLISQQCGAAVLLKQLKAFDSAPTQFNSQTPITHPYPSSFIKRRKHKRAAVIRVQQQLNLKGQQPKLVTDGYFGSTTQQAAKSYQASTHPNSEMLKVDGIVGPKTWKVLFKN